MAKADLIALHIDSALDDVECLIKFEVRSIPLLKFRLVYLKKLVLICSSELASDAAGETLLVRIEDIVCRNVAQIHNCLQLIGETDLPQQMIFEFHKEIRSLKEDFDKWYNIRQPRASCTPDGVLEIISSVAKAVVDARSEIDLQVQESAVEFLEKQLSFLKALISFATKLSVEPNYDLLAPAASITIFLAYRLVTLVPGYGRDLDSLISVFLQEKLEPVCKTYTQVFGSLKSRPLIPHMWDDDVFGAMEVMVGFLTYDLWNLPNLPKSVTWSTLTQDLFSLQGLYGGLKSLRTTLRNKQVLSSLHMEIKKDIGLVVCDAGVFICSLHHTLEAEVDVGFLRHLLDAIHCILADVLVLNAFKTYPAGEVGVKRMPSLGASSSTNEVVGFNDDEEIIVNQLTRGSDELRVVAIVGMPGLGKTTLATKLYNNHSISHHFHVRAWCCVSQTVDKRKTILSLLNQIAPKYRSKTSRDDSLAEVLRWRLKGRRYLILLDDVWDLETWTTLHLSFPNDNVGSRIILTSCRHNVAPPNLMVDGNPYFLRHLNEKESFELLQRECSFELKVDLGMKVAKKCRGLPLMIVIVAGVLKHVESQGWDELLDCLSSASMMEQFRNSLDLSYMQLPDYLKPCLLYFGTFRENEEVSVRRLLRLWVAEGFIQNDDMSSPEECFKGLVDRSLIMVAKQRSLGGAKTCQIHDLIRDFCVQKAKDEGLFHLVRGADELSAFHEPGNLQRLCIHSEAVHFRQSKLFCPSPRSLIINSSESVETLIGRTERSGMSRGFHIFKRLKVLDLEHVHFGNEFPSEIQHFVQLTFLAILCEARAIPPWIGKFSSLETLIKLGDTNGWLPESIWHLMELQHLHLGGGNGYYTFSDENLDSPNTLHKLARISGVVIPYSKMEILLRKFPTIHKLKCRLQYTNQDRNNLVFPNILSQIQSLSLLYVYDEDSSYDKSDWLQSGTGARELSLPANLKKLTLGGFGLSSANMSTIGILPNLEVLKLLRIKFEGRAWVMKEEEFSKLKILKMVDLDLTSWSSDENADPLQCLEKLVLESISQLREMPRCLEGIDTLDVIEVSDCLYSLLDLVEHIERRQKEQMGDSGVKIIRNNIRVQE